MSTRNFVHPQNLDEEDLVADCSPYAEAHFLRKAAHLSNNEKCDSVCDSGVDLRSFQSFGSAYGSLQEKRQETDLLEAKLGDLSLENPKHTTNDQKCSLDGGYISYQGPDISLEDAKEQQYIQISPEVVELYNQDVDGDS